MDVVYLKRGAIFCCCAAHLATVIVAFKDVKTQARLDWLALGLYPFWNFHLILFAPCNNMGIMNTR